MDKILQDTKNQMAQAVAILKEDLGTIRAGRAHPQLVEHLRIKAYGGTQELTLAEMATISASDPKTIVITPFDQSVAEEIERGITQANLGVTVIRDGAIIRVIIPPMTEERRDEFIKLAKTKTEGVHVMIRQARQEGMNQVKTMQQSGDISEDDKFRTEKDIQKITDEKTKEANTLLETKVSELKTV